MRVQGEEQGDKVSGRNVYAGVEIGQGNSVGFWKVIT